MEPLAVLFGRIFRSPRNKELVLSELFSPTDKKPNPASDVCPFT